MRFLRPAVHDLLVLHAGFRDEDVDHFGVCDVTVLFEFEADGLAELRGGDVEREDGAYFGGLGVSCDEVGEREGVKKRRGRRRSSAWMTRRGEEGEEKRTITKGRRKRKTKKEE